NLGLKVRGNGRPSDRRPGVVEHLADCRHALGNADDRAYRRHAAGLALEPGIGLAETCQHRLDVVIARIESKQSLRLHAAAPLNNDGEQFLLALEVTVERALRDSGPAGDLTHAGGVETLRQKDSLRALDDLASLGGLLRSVRSLCGVFDQV